MPRIAWRAGALDDLEQLRAYIARDNQQTAEAVRDRILALVGMLATHPHLGRPGRVSGTRELVIAQTPFIVPYWQPRSGDTCSRVSRGTVRTVFTSTVHVGRSERDALHFHHMLPEPTPGSVATTPDETKYTFAVDQAAERFVAAGFPRSPRSIQRYCQLGHLRAVSLPTESGRIYLIDEKSVEERIEELRQVAPFSRPQGDDGRRDETRHDATERDETRHSATSRVELEEALKRIKDLETETRTLEIDKRVRDAMLEQMQKDRERLLNDLQRFVETMNDQSRQIGRLEAQLALPRPQEGDNSRAREGNDLVQ